MAGICLLTWRDIKVWEQTGHRPKCVLHKHVGFYKALDLIVSDEYVGLGKNGALDDKRVIVEQASNYYHWANTPSGEYRPDPEIRRAVKHFPAGCEVKQLVPTR